MVWFAGARTSSQVVNLHGVAPDEAVERLKKELSILKARASKDAGAKGRLRVVMGPSKQARDTQAANAVWYPCKPFLYTSSIEGCRTSFSFFTMEDTFRLLFVCFLYVYFQSVYLCVCMGVCALLSWGIAQINRRLVWEAPHMIFLGRGRAGCLRVLTCK